MKNLFFLVFFLNINLFPQSTPDGLERQRFYDIQHILIKVSFDESKKIVFGECTTTLQPLNNNFTQFELDANYLNISKVFLKNKKDLKYNSTNDKLIIYLDKPYSKNDKIDVTVVYNCSPKSGLYFIQPDSINPNRPWQIWTQGQGRGNHNWFPMYNYFNDKTTTETIITVKDNYFALSNGKLLDIKHDKIKKLKTYHWKEFKPHVTYLVMMAIGEYSIIRDYYKNIPVEYYVYKGQEEDAKRCFKLTPDMISFFSKKTGVEYPFEKYAQVCLYDYMYGGMENTSATTLNDLRAVYDKKTELDYQNTSLVAHELAHQWYGSLINQRDGINHWLQEGFATYFDALYHEYKYGKDEFMRIMDDNMESYKEAEAKQGKIPMVSKTSPFVYVKGASVLHMLRFILGESDFDKSIKLYTRRFAYKNVTTEDFKQAIFDATGKDLSWFFEEWLFKAGYPEFEVKTNYDENKKLLEIKVIQIHKTDSIVPYFKMPVDIEIIADKVSRIQRVNIEKPDETFIIQCNSRPKNIIFDKGNWFVKNVHFEKSKDELLYQLANATYAIDRRNAANELKKFVRDDIVFNALKQAAINDPNWTVRLECIDTAIIYSRKEGLDILLSTVSDKKSIIRMNSVIALSGFKDSRILPILQKIIEEDSSYYVVSSTLVSLALADPIKSFKIIEQFSRKESYRDIIKIGAITAMGIIGDFYAQQRILDLTRKSEPFNVREKAFKTLIAFRDKSIQDFIKIYFNDPDERIRLAVYQTLESIGDKKILPFLIERESVEKSPLLKDQIKKATSAIRARDY